MLKKYEKIIKSVLSLRDERLSNVYLSPDTGFYYATDGYRMIRFSEQPNELPVETECNMLKKNLPFKLGVQVETSVGKHYIAINPKFLIEAMETTDSNTIMIPKTGQGLLISGNGFEWIIMPVACVGFESDKHMTEIPIE